MYFVFLGGKKYKNLLIKSCFNFLTNHLFDNVIAKFAPPGYAVIKT